MAGDGGCRDERRESSASEVGTVDGTEKNTTFFTCSWYLVFVPELSVANVIFSRLIKDQAGKKSTHTHTQNQWNRGRNCRSRGFALKATHTSFAATKRVPFGNTVHFR